MKNFTNSILLPEELPEIETKTFNPLDKKYLKITLIRMSVFFLLLIGAFISFLFLSDENVPKAVITTIFSVLAFFIIYTVVITIVAFPRKGYLVRENDISFQRGLVTYKLTTVPFNRIQHVEVNQGVLAKLFMLSSLKLYTAGGTASDLSIQGLPEDIAKNLKAFLSEKISEHE
ncbi:PH domain-containing protein [Prolixibacteraceae bacterium Z1-6]|uniref:PH domain-containing protein n=1 Tax=Draconibacterium aestuarii TaxID=2998507 RepID=A0A9X3F6B7_9BACT|nr:PH domain-containing protein [Prolixibacteraceae bacterium Z1-6]